MARGPSCGADTSRGPPTRSVVSSSRRRTGRWSSVVEVSCRGSLTGYPSRRRAASRPVGRCAVLVSSPPWTTPGLDVLRPTGLASLARRSSAITAGGPLAEHLPRVYVDFTERFPDVAEAQGAVARTIRERCPFDQKTDRLITLALAVGAQANGAVRSNVRKALQHGATVEELHAVALAAITTCGFPT